MNTYCGTSDDALTLGIVTISRNDVAGLRRTLESGVSLRNQLKVEHVVVDGGGSNAAEVCGEFGCTHIVQTGTGIGSAFNEGWRRVRSEWVWFLNGGDTVHPNLQLDPLLQILAAVRSDVLTCGVVYESELGWQQPRAYLDSAFPFTCWIAHPGALIRRSLLAKLSGFDESYVIASDFDFWCRAARANAHFDSLSLPLACFDSGGISQSPANRPLLRKENLRILRNNRDLFVRRWGWVTRRLAMLLLGLHPTRI